MARAKRTLESDQTAAPAIPERPVMTELAVRVGYQLRRAHGRSNELYVEMLGKEKVAPGQYGILKIISLNPNRIQKDIAGIAAMDSTTLVPIVEILERRGWIDRTRDPNDRRNLVLSITSAGAAALKKLDRRIDLHEAELTRNLSADEHQVLLDLLSRISGLEPGR